MNTVENAVIVPLFVIVTATLILFNVMLYNRIVTRSRDYRRNYIENFDNGSNQPMETIRAFWAVKELEGNKGAGTLLQ